MTHEMLENDPPVLLPRRTFLVHTLGTVGLVSIGMARSVRAAGVVVENVTGLYSVIGTKVERPVSVAEVSKLVRNWPGKIAVGGGQYSMGGEIALQGGLHLDMRKMNRLVWFRPEERAARLQPGMRWREVQELIDTQHLAVKIMQSYSNFTVGGSVSVNAHGRYVGHGPICNSVRALQTVLARAVSP